MSVFYIVATPIGNLKDVSFRALEVLKSVDLILCEDTRQTQKLLSHYQLEKSLLSYHQHSKVAKVGYILDLLRQGKNLALVSDAGTPGISDPGNKLIEEIISNLPETNIIPIPGPSAVAAALSVSGLPTDKFLFLGFPPMKKKRKDFFESIAASQYTAVFYESPHRVIKSLKELQAIKPDLNIVVCREITKKFETTYRGQISQVIETLEKEGPKGEFTVVIDNRSRQL
jgi:16S rRNA (cytidine1402-2'-O)-methyltransferase